MDQSEIVINYHYGGLNPVQFGHEVCAPSHFYGPAVRTHWLLHYVVSGFGTFVREGVTYRVEPGQVFVIPPYLETYYEADGKRPWHYIWVGFTVDEQFPKELFPPVIISPDLGMIFDEMISCGSLENGRSAFLAACLWKIVAVLLEQEKPKEGYVEKALNCMHTEYSQGIGIQEIADRLGLDRSYFSTLFSRQIGISPSEYLINLRLKKAAALMGIYQESPSTAARSVGYEDLFHFSKIFKKHYGMSPREYRKQAANQTNLQEALKELNEKENME